MNSGRSYRPVAARRRVALVISQRAADDGARRRKRATRVVIGCYDDYRFGCRRWGKRYRLRYSKRRFRHLFAFERAALCLASDYCFAARGDGFAAMLCDDGDTTH